MEVKARWLQRFEVVAQVGSGGMGAVFRARDPQLERDVAIKVLAHPEVGVHDQLPDHHTVDLRGEAPAPASDLLHEARMMARLSHPNVLPVYEVGVADDKVFVVMEYIDGSDVRTWLAAPRTTAEILEVFVQAGRGLDAAHAHNIVHRDFKPENVLVGSDGRVRVADFGLSRLAARPANHLGRTDDAHGTPRYMAPELWAGGLATKPSDVYAFCVALAEALEPPPGKSRALSPRVRLAIANGLLPDPAARWDLRTIVTALESRDRVRRSWRIVGAAAVALAVGGVTALVIAPASPPVSRAAPPCVVPPGLAVGRWDPPRRAALRAALDAWPREAARRDAVDRAIAALDTQQAEIEDGFRAACAAVAKAEITVTQSTMRRSCLERHEYALGSAITQLIQAPPREPGRILERSRVGSVAGCTDLIAPPLPAGRAPVIALYERFAVAQALAPGGARLATLAAIERDAAALGELELEMIAAFNVGLEQRAADLLAVGDEAMQRAYRLAVDLHSTEVQGTVLVERSHNATLRGDPREAVSLARLALDLADRPTSAVATRGSIYAAIGRAELDGGEVQPALDKLNKALDNLARDGHRMPTVELNARFDRAKALSRLEGHNREVVEFQRENLAWARAAFGERSAASAAALDALGAALQDVGDLPGALAHRKEALAVAIEVLPPGAAAIELKRIDYAMTLEANGSFEDAYREFSQVLEAAQRNEALRQARASAQAWLGLTTCELGRCNEGLPMVIEAVEQLTAQFGAAHALTLLFRMRLLEVELDLGKLEAAARSLRTLDAAYRARADSHDRRLTYLQGAFGSALALASGKPRRAESLARSALGAWDELHGEDDVRVELLGALGAAQLAQRRWQAARAALERAVGLAPTAHVREDVVARLEVNLALVDARQGKHPDAVRRARRARGVLERYPIAIQARRDADRLIGATGRP